MLIPDNQKPLNVTCFRDLLFVKLTLLFCYVYFRRDYYKHCFMKKKRKTHATAQTSVRGIHIQTNLVILFQPGFDESVLDFY